MDAREAGSLAVGSLLVTAGSGLAGLAAFDDRVWLVTLGFLGFFVGYRVCQFGAHADGATAGFRRSVRGLASPEGLRRAGLLGLGLFGIAYGVTLFSQTIVAPGLGRAALSGVSSIGGYAVAHVGMNGNLI